MSLANQNGKLLGQVLSMPLDMALNVNYLKCKLEFFNPRAISSSAEKSSEPSKGFTLRASTELDETISERG